MLHYSGSISMSEKYTKILNMCKELIELLEQLYVKNNLDTSRFCVTIENVEIIEKLKKAKTENEQNTILKENKVLYPYYKKELFNRLVSDFCLYMQDSLKAVFDFKPQIAFTLARKPLIDDVFYLQYLYKQPINCIDLVFSNNAGEKDIHRNRKLDEQLSREISNELGYEEDFIYSLRTSDTVYSIRHNCDKSLHIVMSKSKVQNTISGELNFVFLHNDEIKNYVELYLDSVPSVLFYVVALVLKINEQLFEKIDSAQKELKKLQETYTGLLGE